jgi:hypothetical protein
MYVDSNLHADCIALLASTIENDSQTGDVCEFSYACWLFMFKMCELDVKKALSGKSEHLV